MPRQRGEKRKREDEDPEPPRRSSRQRIGHPMEKILLKCGVPLKEMGKVLSLPYLLLVHPRKSQNPLPTQ